MRLKIFNKALAYLVNLPLYWITRLTPRRRNRWVFGAWLGERYADNPRHFMEWVVENAPHVDAIWLAGTRAMHNELRARGVRSEYRAGIRGYWAAATASLAIVSGGTADVNRFVCPPRVLMLWHGTGLMKRIEFDSPPVAARLARRKKIARLFPFHERREFAAMTASSQEEANQLACAFRSDAAKVHVTGQPRNDRLAIMDRPRLGSSTLHLLYAPTFRDTDPSASIRQILENAAAIQATLEELDAWLHVRLHPNSPRPEEGCVGGRVRFESKLASSEDPVEALEAADVLITDYSSIFVDYLLTRRPIIFFPYDLDRYLTSERDFYFDYLDPVITPGPRCTTWTEVIRLVRDVAAGADPYRDQRLAALARWHHFVDGDNSLRVMDLASNLVQRRERR